MANDGLLGWDDLADFSDETTLKRALGGIDTLDKAYEKLANDVSKNAKKIGEDLAKVHKEAASLAELKTPDLRSEQKANGGADKLLQQNEALKKSYQEQQAVLVKLQAEIEKLKKLKASIPPQTDAEVGSLTKLKAELKAAELGYRAMGKATSEAVKQDALVKINGLAEAVSKGERALRDTKRGVTIASGSYHELAREVQRLNADFKNMPDILGKNKKAAEELASTIHKKTEQLKRLDESVNTNWRSVGKYSDALKGLKGTIADALSIGSFTAFFGTIIAGFSSIIKTNKDFEKSLSTLKAILGASKEEMVFFREESLQIGLDTKTAATDVVEGFKLMGSAAPELLKNKKALSDTTREAIILSQAAGIDVPEAVQALASTMAQFNLPAEEARRIINSLAAGSKVGAAEVPQLTEAIDKAGLTAANFNVSLEETVGAIETLSAANLKGAEAGTALRNVLLNMSTIKALPKAAQEELQAFGVDIKKVADETIPLEERLSELAKISGDATAMVKVFGKENVNAAGALLQNIDLFKEYTEGVTGTNTALEQQAAAIDNLDGDWDKFTKLISNTVSQGAFLNDAMRSVVQSLIFFVNALRGIPAFVGENKEAIAALVIAVLALNGANIAAAAATLKAAAAERIKTTWTKASAAAQWALNAAMTANPIGIVVAAVALLVAGFVTLYKNSEQVRGAIAGMGNVAVVLGETFAELGGVLKGVGQIMLGVLIPNPDRIKKGIAAVQDGASKAFKGLGEKLAAAYNTGYNDLLASERKGQLKEEEKHQGTVAGFVTEIEEHKREEIEKTSKAAKEARKKAEEEYKKLLEIEKSRVGAVEKNNAKLLKAEQELTQARLRERIAAADLDAQSGPGREDAIIRRVELEKQLAKEVAQAKIQLGREQLKVLDQQLAEELQKVEGNAKLQEAVRISFIDQRLSLEKAITKEEEVINEVLQKELTKLVKEGVEERKQLRRQEILNGPEDKLADQTQTITREFNQAGDFSAAAELQLYKDLEKAHEDFLSNKIQALKDAQVPIEEIKRAEFEREKYYANKSIEEAKRVRDQKNKFLQDAQTAAIDLMNGLHELQKVNSDARIATIEQERDRELESLALNEEGKERLRQVYDEKIRKEQLKQAKRDKQMRIFQATIAGVQAVVNALSSAPPPYNFILAALVGAAAGVQIAAIKKAPLPQFFKGTMNAPEGFAIVDERGPEVIESGGKKYLGYSDGPRITYLNKGDKVYPHHSMVTQEILAAADTTHQAQGTTVYFQSRKQSLEQVRPKPVTAKHIQEILNIHVERETDRIVNAVRNIPEIGSQIDELGEIRHWKKVQNKKTYLSQRYRRHD